MRRLLSLLVSARTTLFLMLAMALLLLAGVAVPQRALLGDAAVGRIAGSNPIHAFVIDTIGLGAIATSPLFLLLLLLFYLNLAVVLLHRMPAVIGKTRVRPPSLEALEKWVSSPHAIERTIPGGIAAGSVVAALRGFGYRPHRVSNSSLYGVKHRNAAIGFLLFHFSFFLLCVGGALIWYTRWVGELRVVEGQSVDATSAHVLRQRPAGGTPDVRFTLQSMSPSFVKGEATDLRATVRFAEAGPVEAWVNHPAERGAVSLLVSDVGIAPVLWLQDSRGFGVDRVAVPAERGNDVDIPMAGGIVRVRIVGAERNSSFPPRASLALLPLSVVIHQGTREAFRGTLRPGEAATLPGGRLVLTEVRYWGGMKIVSERGGVLLIAGFVLATIGATWRLLLHRRDVVVSWNTQTLRLAGHGEWFADRHRRELQELAEAMTRAAAKAGSRAVTLNEVEVNA